ncbi:MAG: PD-(D/E)XK nuclease family protein [Xanthomonadales bacterium]|nr:PD-(D/E)XK nuclease family protein [Xanthomonadales bacterium]
MFARLWHGHVLVTANNRLARVLGGQYAAWRLAAGDLQWPSPGIDSWAAWLDRLWEKAALAGAAGTDRAVPGDSQLLSLWETVLNDTPLAHDLLRPESLAGQLRDARKLAIEWHLDLAHPAWYGNENYTAFHRWNQAFEKHCQYHHWISPEDRTAVLTEVVRKAGGPLSANIDLLGFDEFKPVQADLLRALIESGSTVTRLEIEPRQEKAVLLECKDSHDELQQMARWVRHCVEENADSTIAIVVPDLQSRRQELEWHLEEILAPGSVGDDKKARPWNVSGGIPLTRLSMIEAAFDLLKLLQTNVHIQDISRVLRSPWLKDATNERGSRALLEKRLRDEYPRLFKLSEAEYRSRELKKHDHYHAELPEEEYTARAWNSPVLNAILNSLIRFRTNNRGNKPASAWAEAIDHLLADVGWPDETGITAVEHDENWQALQAWREALHELASLDTATAPFDLVTAVNHLKQICREKPFQAKTPPASIQVLGLYEVNGLRFDHLWVLGMNAESWPPTARPNPFIPSQLQLAANLPRSSPQRELAVAQTLTQRLLKTAPDCVFTYPARRDGEDLKPSPLLNDPGIQKVDSVPAWPAETWRQVITSAEKPCIQPLVMPGKLTHPTTRGGSSILKNQALCPFRAFASNRLGAESLQAPADGISPMLHGSLVHRVLEVFWQETVTRAALLQLDDATLDERVHQHVESVTRADRGLQQRPAFRRVEAGRIQRHVLAYLELEKQRGPFEAVGFEKEVLIEMEGQVIRLFIDRVDRLPDGDEIIIDYKTGTMQPKKWFGARPEDPQLPLYAISAKKAPAAVVFGVIREDGCEYKGVVRHPGLFPGLPPKETNSTRYLVEAGSQMPETIDNWRQTLHHLMSDFLAGEAVIDPKNGRSTCNNSFCELQSLCRITELEQLQRTRQQAPA